MNKYLKHTLDVHSFALGVASAFWVAAIFIFGKGLYYGFPVQEVSSQLTFIDGLEMIAVGLFVYAMLIAWNYADDWWKARWNDAN